MLSLMPVVKLPLISVDTGFQMRIIFTIYLMCQRGLWFCALVMPVVLQQ